MADKKQDTGFKVSDRRLFTADGDLRTEVEEEISAQPAEPKPAPEDAAHAISPQASTQAGTQPETTTDSEEPNAPPPPTAAEQKAQADAYKQSSRDMDRRVELSGHSARELQMNFERFMASLYMSAMLQLGLMHEEGGQPRVDLIGARQTIDTLALLQEKTKGNLTATEENFLQNCLYELRMAYVEVTNALARPPQAPGSVTGTNGR